MEVRSLRVWNGEEFVKTGWSEVNNCPFYVVVKNEG